MVRRRFFPLTFAGFAVVAMLVLMTGCSMDPMGPLGPDGSAEGPEWVTYELPEEQVSAKTLGGGTWVDTDVIDEEGGGRLKIGNYGLKVTLKIPGIEGDTKKMTLSLASHQKVMVDIKPSGTKFSSSATLTARGTSINLPEGRIALYYYDNGQWIVMSSAKVTDDGKTVTLTAKLKHCSRYAFGFRR